MSCARLKPTISLIVPTFNEAEVLPVFHERATRACATLGEPYEIIYVDDGSTDATPALLVHLRQRAPDTVKVLLFSRNFGQQAALTAGMDYSRGDAVILIDSDLQDPPELIPALVGRWRDGHDIVLAVRERRLGDSWLKVTTAACFYRVMRRLSTVDIPLDTGYYRLMSRQVVDALRSLKERNRFLKAMIGWVGFSTAAVPYVRDQRYCGATKYSYRKLLALALGAILDYSILPLHAVTTIGFTFSLLALLAGLAAIVSKLCWRVPIAGWPSLFLVVVFLGGVQLMAIGLLGAYIARIYQEVKQRPLYLVREAWGIEEGVTGGVESLR